MRTQHASSLYSIKFLLLYVEWVEFGRMRGIGLKRVYDIAALIIEPIQGEGGDNHFRCEFFQKLRELADEHDLYYEKLESKES